MIQTTHEIRKIPIKDIVFRKDLYPRFEPDQKTIEKYSNSVEYLPPIKINQDNILIDGFHRWKAHELAGLTEIEAEVINTESDAELKILSYETNSTHGLQLTSDEKKRFAQEEIGIIDAERIAKIISVRPETVRVWTKSQREALEAERDRKIIEMYLHAENTQQMISNKVRVDQGTVSRVIDKIMQNGEISEFHKELESTFIYDTWNLGKTDNETSHFGAFPIIFMERLLYDFTKPLDIVFDPFAGSGTTIDTCKKMMRRFYSSDLKVKPGREDDVKQWDISQGLPPDLPKPDFVFLDPPYWKQAKGKYTDLPTDLSNVDLETFNSFMKSLLDALKNRKVERIAIVIRDSRDENYKLISHMDYFRDILADEYETEEHFELPYSTEQYSGSQVEWAKKNKKHLGTRRELRVFKRKEAE